MAVAVVAKPEIAWRHDLKQGRAVDHVAAAVRHLDAESCDLAVLLDDPAQQPRRHQEYGRVGSGQGLLEFSGRE